MNLVYVGGAAVRPSTSCAQRGPVCRAVHPQPGLGAVLVGRVERQHPVSLAASQRVERLSHAVVEKRASGRPTDVLHGPIPYASTKEKY